MAFIASTLTNANVYNIYAPADKNDMSARSVLKSIHVKGGANLTNTHNYGHSSLTADGLPIWTPSGNVTRVTDEELALLKEHPVFKQHLEQGYVKILAKAPSDSGDTLDKVTSEMTSRDNSAPHTLDTLKKLDARNKTLKEIEPDQI